MVYNIVDLAVGSVLFLKTPTDCDEHSTFSLTLSGGTFHFKFKWLLYINEMLVEIIINDIMPWPGSSMIQEPLFTTLPDSTLLQLPLL